MVKKPQLVGMQFKIGLAGGKEDFSYYFPYTHLIIGFGSDGGVWRDSSTVASSGTGLSRLELSVQMLCGVCFNAFFRKKQVVFR